MKKINILLNQLSKYKEDFSDVWDKKGIGSVPIQLNMYYYGFEYPVKPSLFLAMVPERILDTKNIEYIKTAMGNGEKFAPPWLDIQRNPRTLSWKIINHEGRGRVTAFMELHGDTPIMVGMFPFNENRSIRNKDLLSSMFTFITPQENNAGGRTKRIILREQLAKREN